MEQVVNTVNKDKPVSWFARHRLHLVIFFGFVLHLLCHLGR